MKLDEVEAVVQAIMDNYCVPTLMTKGKDYAQQHGPDAKGADDLTFNFNIMAERCGPCDAFDIWHVYFQKHAQALETWLNSKDKDGKRHLDSEPIHERIMDILNYGMILWMMGIDHGIMPDPRQPKESKRRRRPKTA